MRFEGNRALVKADTQDKKVSVAVSGSLPGRRRLQPQEMIPLPGYPEVALPYQTLQVTEDNGIQTFPEVVGDRVVIDVDVHALLNGVELENAHRRVNRG